jgi:hypothetical protein
MKNLSNMLPSELAELCAEDIRAWLDYDKVLHQKVHVSAEDVELFEGLWFKARTTYLSYLVSVRRLGEITQVKTIYEIGGIKTIKISGAAMRQLYAFDRFILDQALKKTDVQSEDFEGF